jgi:hypothetical protein
LTKDDVGRAKPTCYDLPEFGFSFGRPNDQDGYGAGESIAKWHSHIPSSDPRGEPGIYFPVVNKVALKNGIFNPKDAASFHHDMKQTIPHSARDAPTGDRSAKAKDMIPSDLMPEFSYGRKVRPSTPMQQIVSNRYGVAAEQAMGEHTARQAEEKARGSSVYKIKSTMASRGHRAGGQAVKMCLEKDQYTDAQPAFKLKKFQNIRSKLDHSWKSGGSVAAADLMPVAEGIVTPPPAEPVLGETEA